MITLVVRMVILVARILITLVEKHGNTTHEKFLGLDIAKYPPRVPVVEDKGQRA